MLKDYLHKELTEAGCDEAGRGCLAGPVCAAAVILPPNFNAEDLNDSKKLNVKQRNELRILIEEKALDWAVAFVDNKEIDEINILNASILAMHRALEKLKLNPLHILVDGNKFEPFRQIPHTCIIKGDGKMKSIAAASILAKTHRDDFMHDAHHQFHHYGWNTNKGYPTSGHIGAIEKFGYTPLHRTSFQIKKQLKLDL